MPLYRRMLQDAVSLQRCSGLREYLRDHCTSSQHLHTHLCVHATCTIKQHSTLDSLRPAFCTGLHSNADTVTVILAELCQLCQALKISPCSTHAACALDALEESGALVLEQLHHKEARLLHHEADEASDRISNKYRWLLYKFG